MERGMALLLTPYIEFWIAAANQLLFQRSSNTLRRCRIQNLKFEEKYRRVLIPHPPCQSFVVGMVEMLVNAIAQILRLADIETSFSSMKHVETLLDGDHVNRE